IILIILGDVLGLPVGDLFQAAVAPGLLLIGLYIGYIIFVTVRDPDKAPPMPPIEQDGFAALKTALFAILPPLLLIVLVLGSIFAGIATPTESSALGGVGALVLALCYGQFNIKMLWESARETVVVTAMVFAILLG
ncbi:TRAP transporter large permease subunit, partial [Oleiphilus sp. HI0080]